MKDRFYLKKEFLLFCAFVVFSCSETTLEPDISESKEIAFQNKSYLYAGDVYLGEIKRRYTDFDTKKVNEYLIQTEKNYYVFINNVNKDQPLFLVGDSASNIALIAVAKDEKDLSSVEAYSWTISITPESGQNMHNYKDSFPDGKYYIELVDPQSVGKTLQMIAFDVDNFTLDTPLPKGVYNRVSYLGEKLYPWDIFDNSIYYYYFPVGLETPHKDILSAREKAGLPAKIDIQNLKEVEKKVVLEDAK